jgi:Fic family protein
MQLPEKAPKLLELLRVALESPGRMERILDEGLGSEPDGRYLHWDELRRRTPSGDLSLEEWWLAIGLKREALRTPLPFRDKGGHPFWFARTSSLDEGVHQIDRSLGGQMEAEGSEIATPERRDRHLIASLMEEAISSSQLEGASTTRQVAKEMLLTGRAPLDRSERMIANNFQAMNFLREHLTDALSQDLLLQLHRILTEGTLDDPDAVGRFRRKDEAVIVQSNDDATVLHVPPDAEALPERLSTLYRFANETPGGAFVHPFVRAAALHFMLSYEHPFVDGNGRTARTLFYWSMLRQKYWLTEFLAISRIIKTAPGQYRRAFLHSETSGGDITYFLLHHLEVVLRAATELFTYLEREEKQLRETERILKGAKQLNHRQRALLSHALRHPQEQYTIQAHQRAHGVVYQTARQDLLDLVRSGYLEKRKRGHAFIFVASRRMSAALKRA